MGHERLTSTSPLPIPFKNGSDLTNTCILSKCILCLVPKSMVMLAFHSYTAGEPLNESAWKWYNEKVGKGRCHVVDAWWQTGTCKYTRCVCICLDYKVSMNCHKLYLLVKYQ